MGEDTEHSLRLFKEIQKEWKAVGAVPQNQIKTLWANYNALVDRVLRSTEHLFRA